MAISIEGQRGWAMDSDADAGERAYAACNHLVFLALPIPVIPQLVMWLIRRDASPFLDDHGKEALNFQISILLLSAMAGMLIIVGIGLLFLLALPWFMIICTIVAGVKAAQGQYFRYPMTIRLIK